MPLQFEAEDMSAWFADYLLGLVGGRYNIDEGFDDVDITGYQRARLDAGASSFGDCLGFLEPSRVCSNRL